MVVGREPWDPPRAAIVEILCPDCVEETSAHEPPTYYYDKNDKELSAEECKAAADMAWLHFNREAGQA